MPRASSVSLLLLMATLLGGVLATAQTANPDRIAQKVEANQMELVLGSVHPLAQAEFDQGPVAGSMPLAHVSIVFRLSDAQQEALDQLLAEQQDPSSANFHKWLTPEQYADRFGLTPGDTAKVVSWLKSQGLTVESVSRSRTEIFFAGSAAQISSALRTEIHRFSMNSKNHFANVTEPSVPSAFAGMVLGFRNLDDFRPKSRMRVLPHFTSNISGIHFLVPDDFATIYDLQSLYTAGLDGTGVAIGVVGDSAITLGDIEAFRSAAGLSASDPVVVPVTGETPIHNGDDEVEADLDIEWSGGVAKNATIIYYVAGTSGGNSPNAFDALQFAIDDDATRVISNSFGNCEANLGSNNANIIRGWITQAVSQGQTVTTASGDTGASDCETQSATVATLGLGVDLPAAIPEITAVGGTEFTGDPAAVVSGSCAAATTFWAGSCSPTSGGSALSYIPEMTWNDGPAPGTGAFTTLAAGGGGASTLFTKAQAPWQNGVTPNDGKRDVPDVALNASPAHDAYLICSQESYNEHNPGVTSCTTGFRGSDQTLNPIGGTSAGAPTMAGIVAIINQATKSCGLGNINGSSGGATGLYKLAASQPTAFHDILPPPTSGNIVPCTKGTTGCPATAPFQYGFSTTTGYDQATGLGSVNADILTKNWPGYDPGQTLTSFGSSCFQQSQRQRRYQCDVHRNDVDHCGKLPGHGKSGALDRRYGTVHLRWRPHPPGRQSCSQQWRGHLWNHRAPRRHAPDCGQLCRRQQLSGFNLACHHANHRRSSGLHGCPARSNEPYPDPGGFWHSDADHRCQQRRLYRDSEPGLCAELVDGGNHLLAESVIYRVKQRDDQWAYDVNGKDHGTHACLGSQPGPRVQFDGRQRRGTISPVSFWPESLRVVA